MHWINWLIVGAYVAWVVVDGIRKAKDTDTGSGYFLANKSLSWWVVGLSVMATQLSAVTMIGTPGQGATDGMRFIQLYLGLPLAMVILGVTIVPLLHGAGVYTAYEYLERRFDSRTRSLTSFLFLISRGLSAGAIMAAPGVVFSAVFGIPLVWAVALIGIPTVIYTMIGGVQAVAWADVKQMVLIVIALVAIMIVLIVKMPVNPDEALRIAGATGRLEVFDFSFDLSERYTFWSGVIGGTFLMLSYFGTDQSQVQRYLAAKSVGQAKSSLLAAHERVLEDPTTGARAHGGSWGIRLLPVRASTPPLQPGAGGRGGGRARPHLRRATKRLRRGLHTSAGGCAGGRGCIRRRCNRGDGRVRRTGGRHPNDPR